MWFTGRFFKYTVGILLVLLIIFMIGKIDFFLVPFKQFIAILFFPILISGLLYYMLRPLVNIVEKWRINRTLSIAIVLLVVVLLIALASAYAGSIIAVQLNQLMNAIPDILRISRDKTTEIINSGQIGALITGNIKEQLAAFMQNIAPAISKSIFDFIGAVANFAAVLVVVPFILFYFLKDDRFFATKFLDVIPPGYKGDVKEIMIETDRILSTYITGKAIIALVLGVMMYIGYLIIGMDYALILSLFVAVTSFIPLLGTIIGIIPAILVSLAGDLFMIVKILIVMIIVQQLEGNLISPQLMGKRLDIHPLTLILLFLVAASLYGLVGMLIVVPVYAVLRVIIGSALRIYGEHKSKTA